MRRLGHVFHEVARDKRRFSGEISVVWWKTFVFRPTSSLIGHFVLFSSRLTAEPNLGRGQCSTPLGIRVLSLSNTRVTQSLALWKSL